MSGKVEPVAAHVNPAHRSEFGRGPTPRRDRKVRVADVGIEVRWDRSSGWHFLPSETNLLVAGVSCSSS